MVATTAAEPRRVERGRSLREHALDEIRTAIVTGELAENKVYSAAGLAKQLGISLSPVREAMMSLVSEGTVEAVPNRGFRLVPVTAEDLEEIIKIRVLLAVPAVEELCDTAAEADLARLRTHAEAALAAAEAGDKVGFLAADRKFHAEVLRLGLGPRASALSMRLRDQSRLGEVGHKSRAVDLESAVEINRLLDLIAAGDKAGAVAQVRDNLYYFRKLDSSAGTDEIAPAGGAAGLVAHGIAGPASSDDSTGPAAADGSTGPAAADGSTGPAAAGRGR